MEQQQLKQFAGRLRALLEEASIVIGHSQALELNASLVGLRNWPEVLAFPQRVRSQDLDLSAASRLAYRLKTKYNHDMSPPELLQLLLPPSDLLLAHAPQIWPAGPSAGVYLTTSQDAIDALIATYQEATDGALFYSERVGTHHEGAIDLGDEGLWSSGLGRVPSGTLIVLGPIEMDQQSWAHASERIEMACLRAENSGHRVAILFDTPAPEQLGADVITMVVNRELEDLDRQIVGSVLEDGTLQTGLVRTYGKPLILPSCASTSSLPTVVIEQLQATLAKRSTGILAMGSPTDLENPGSDVGEAGLALTDHLGPAARIMCRHRSTMSKFDDVPAAIAQLPFVPSIESAYAQGYRRFICDPRYAKSKIIAPFVTECMFIACTYASTVEELAFIVDASYGRDASLLPSLIAAVAVAPVKTVSRTELLADLYIGPDEADVDDSEKTYDFIASRRTLRIEEQFRSLVDTGAIDIESARKAGIGDRTIRSLTRLLNQV